MKTVHIVCARLRDKPCLGCPAWEMDAHYGKVQRGCYGLAAELVHIVRYGGPWLNVLANRRWRKRAEEYRDTEVL